MLAGYMNLGDFAPGDILYGKFVTVTESTGAPTTLSGSPVLSVYKDASTTESTTGVTLTAGFDSRTGFNHFKVDTSADGTFYSAGSFFTVVITTGTVGGTSAVGYVVASFTLTKATANATLLAAQPAVTFAALTVTNNLLVSGNTEFSGTFGVVGDTTISPAGTTYLGYVQIAGTNGNPGIYIAGFYDDGVNPAAPAILLRGGQGLGSNPDADGILIAGSGGTVPGKAINAVGNVNLQGGLSGTTNCHKNTALAGYEFQMVDSATYLPKTGLTVTGKVSIDGAAYASLTNAVSEVGNGTYKVNLAAADMNGNVINLKFTATGAAQVNNVIITTI